MCSNRQRVARTAPVQADTITPSVSHSESQILCDFHLATSHNTPCEQQYTPPRLPPRPVHFMDVFTGEITVYDSLYQAGKAMNIVSSAIALQLSCENNLRLFARRYIVLDKTVSFDNVTPAVRAALLVRAIKGYFVYDRDKEQTTFFPTLPKLIRYYALTVPGYCITYSLKHRRFYRPTPTLFITKSELELYRLTEDARVIWFKDKIKFLN